MLDSVSKNIADSTTAIYVLSTIICATLFLSIIKICLNRRRAAKEEMASIEAFSYDENSNVVNQQAEEETEDSSN